MANSAQARKRARQAHKRELHNASLRSAVRTAIKKVLKLIQSDKPKAQTEMQKATSLIDRVAKQNVIHKNKAARLKSRLNKKIHEAA